MLVKRPSSPRPTAEPEVCLNLWYVCEEGGLVYRLAGRAYALSGTDDDKLRILRQLSATDFFLARIFVVPDRYTVVGDDAEMRGLISPVLLHKIHSDVYKEVIDAIEQSLPTQMRSVNNQPQAFKRRIPQDPLIVLTCICEAEDGTLTPFISDSVG